jgi:hypothetical protein
MTLSQFIEVVRRRHNAESDTFWSDSELYQLITNRANEALSIIGLLEATTSTTSNSGTQAYNFPSDASTIAQINYKGFRLKQITFRQWEHFKSETTTVSGTPEYWVKWNRQFLLIPIPNTSSDAMTIYYYKEHPYINGSSQNTIDIPAVLHPHLVFGVLSDMFAKDQNPSMAKFYEDKWLNVSIPAMYKFKSNDDFTSFNPSGDADSDFYTFMGVS